MSDSIDDCLFVSFLEQIRRVRESKNRSRRIAFSHSVFYTLQFVLHLSTLQLIHSTSLFDFLPFAAVGPSLLLWGLEQTRQQLVASCCAPVREIELLPWRSKWQVRVLPSSRISKTNRKNKQPVYLSWSHYHLFSCYQLNDFGHTLLYTQCISWIRLA